VRDLLGQPRIGCRGWPMDVMTLVISYDHAGTEKSDSRHDARDDAACVSEHPSRRDVLASFSFVMSKIAVGRLSP
jgi:hypothetical protein